MASTVPAFNDNLNIIQALTDEPNDMDGLTAAELKAKFDEAGNLIKNYLNNRLRPFVNGVNQNLEELEKEFLEGSDAGLAYENHMDNRTAIALLLNYARQVAWSLDDVAQEDLLDHAAAISLLLNFARQTGWRTDELEKAAAQEVGTVTLTNSLRFPFNNSKRTVALASERDNLNYIVVIVAVTGTGNIGEVEVTDRLVNGFKLNYTGSAANAAVTYAVIGGYDK